MTRRDLGRSWSRNPNMAVYDSARFKPPAPLAHVKLRQTGTANAIHDVPMLMDFGADATLLPSGYVAKIGLPAKSGVGIELMGFDGTKSISRVVELDLVF